MICKTGGFISLRHNDHRDITYELLSEVCKGVENEPMLHPLTGETLKYQTAKTENRARLDVSALGFWCRDQRAFFDITVFDPVAPSHAHQSLDAAHSKQENEKCRHYEDRILHAEHASFTPLLFTIAGGMSKCTKKFFSRLGEMLADKRLQPKSIVFHGKDAEFHSLSCDLRQDAYEAQDTEKKLPPTSNTSIYSNI